MKANGPISETSCFWDTLPSAGELDWGLDNAPRQERTYNQIFAAYLYSIDSFDYEQYYFVSMPLIQRLHFLFSSIPHSSSSLLRWTTILFSAELLYCEVKKIYMPMQIGWWEK